MKKKENLSKSARISLYTIIAIAIIYFLWVMYTLLNVPNWFLVEKTDFKNYEAFRKKTTSYYPDFIPNEDTNDIEYYYLKGHYNNITAVSFEVDDKTYNELKDYYDNHSLFAESDHDSAYDLVVRYQPLTKDILMKDELKYIRDMISNVDDYEILHLTILKERFLNQDAGYNDSAGVFYSKNESRIIIFIFKEEVNVWGNFSLR